MGRSSRRLNVSKTIHRSGRIGIILTVALAGRLVAADQVRVESGTLEGSTSSDSRIRIYKGIPFAAPPVGKLRWQAPQPMTPWTGTRKATEFGARCAQGQIYQDMVFRDPGPSEDCLYLNVWTPATSETARLPVMVWIFGGGFQAGSPSEPRQDGENLAHNGVIVVTLNYRLGVFGFLSHPELTRESPHHASGNYGFLDQMAALQWVHKNIEAFGGDPNKVTIFGESAGSISVSAQVASPLSKGLFQRAIGESGGVFSLTAPTTPLAKPEETGAAFARALGANTIDELRSKSQEEILQAALSNKSRRFWPNVDGYFLPEDPASIYRAGKQAHVPLLAGWNTDEQNYAAYFGNSAVTKENYEAKIREQYGSHAAEILKAYPADSDKELRLSAGALAGDRFIAYSTWRWLEAQLATGESSVYAYHFEQAPPATAGSPSRGAYHSADIEYVFGTLKSKDLPWTAADEQISRMISAYWTNFAKTGDPNGQGLPVWPTYKKADGYQLMHLKVDQPSAGAEAAAPAVPPLPRAYPDEHRARYELLERISEERTKKSTSP